MRAPTAAEVFGRRPDRRMARCVRGKGSSLTFKQFQAKGWYLLLGRSVSAAARRLKRNDKTIREHLAACVRKGAM